MKPDFTLSFMFLNEESETQENIWVEIPSESHEIQKGIAILIYPLFPALPFFFTQFELLNLSGSGLG